MGKKTTSPREAEIRPEHGYFVFSLDTELAWGYLWSRGAARRGFRNAAVERAAIRRLLDLMDEYGVRATWAFTGHLFYESCEECAICPIMDLKGRDARFERIWGTGDAMWYGPDILEAVVSRNSGHEIACHGYTHRYFDKLTKEEARFEIHEWLRLADRRGLPHYSMIFPQGRIHHLDLFREAGFICYRGKDVRHPALAVPLVGKLLNRLNLKLALLPPQVYEPRRDASGLVNIPSSQWIFRTHRGLESALDWLRLPYLRLVPAARAIRKAAETRQVIHLWAHPHEFRTDRDFEKLRFLFRHFAAHAREGTIQSITMADLAKRVLDAERLEADVRPAHQAAAVSAANASRD